MRSGRPAQGFTYLGALLGVAIVGAGLAATGEIWSHARQREKEAELIWIGAQFTQAIGLYYQRSPGAVKRYPSKLEDLLEDRRYPTTQRYLRKIYTDPLSGKPAWDLIPAPGGGIMGVRSFSTAKSIRVMKSGATYSAWRFVYEPPVATIR
jgi:type II secretory pathway pseudopilin PulG